MQKKLKGQGRAPPGGGGFRACTDHLEMIFRVVVKLSPAIPGGSVEHGEAEFSTTTHVAVLSKLCIHLPRMSSVS